MVEWGHGDPRWIVEERKDGTNVNNWHRTERDATSQSKGKLCDLLVGIIMENEAGSGEICEPKQVEGVIKEPSAKHKGLIEICNLSEENEVDDIEMRIYNGNVLPRKAMATQELTVKRKLRTPCSYDLWDPGFTSGKVRIPPGALHMTELFDATTEQLYIVFTGKDLTNKKIFMKWRCRNWPEEHYATVALSFVPTPGQTELQLDCSGVPVCKEEHEILLAEAAF